MPYLCTNKIRVYLVVHQLGDIGFPYLVRRAYFDTKLFTEVTYLVPQVGRGLSMEQEAVIRYALSLLHLLDLLCNGETFIGG